MYDCVSYRQPAPPPDCGCGRSEGGPPERALVRLRGEGEVRTGGQRCIGVGEYRLTQAQRDLKLGLGGGGGTSAVGSPADEGQGWGCGYCWAKTPGGEEGRDSLSRVIIVHDILKLQL